MIRAYVAAQAYAGLPVEGYLQVTRSFTLCVPSNVAQDSLRMLEQEDVPDLVLDLEKRIDRMQDMGDEQLGTFSRLDWVVLVVLAIVLPIIAIELAR